MLATAVTSFLTLAELYPYYQQAVKTFYNTNLPIIYQNWHSVAYLLQKTFSGCHCPLPEWKYSTPNKHPSGV